MPSANDVYITPASRKIQIYNSSAVTGLISGSTNLYVSGSGDLYLDADAVRVGDSSATTNRLIVERASTDETYDILHGKVKYPRIRLEDLNASASMYVWHLGNQLRFGTNAGSSTTAAMYVQNGQPSDGLAYGKVVMNSAVLAGTDNPINSSRVSIVDTTRPLVLGYDGSNYTDFEINSAGGLTVDSPHTINLDAARHFEIRAGSGRDVRFMFNGTERASIIESSSMARMGINVTSPPASLAIAGDGTKEEGLMMSGDDGTQYLSLYVDAANPSRYFKLQHNSSYGGIQILDSAGNRDGYFYADANGPALAASNGYTGLQVGTGAGGSAANTITHIFGKMGIGTSSPSYELTLSDKFMWDGNHWRANQTNGASMRNEVPSATNPVFTFNNDVDTGMSRAAADELSLITAGTEAIRVDSSQNVGIGTTSPSYPLQVMGEIALGVAGNSYTGDRIKGDTGKIKFTANGGVQATLDGTGLGLGTTSPSDKLHVIGNALVDGNVRIDNGHTIDFDSRAYIDVNQDGGTGEDKFHIRRRGASDEIIFDTSTTSAPIIDSPNGTINLQAASNPVVQLKDDTGFIMQDNMGVKSASATLDQWPLDAGTGKATATVQGFSKIQNIVTAGVDPASVPSFEVKLPSASVGAEYIIVFGSNQANLSGKALTLIANGSDVLHSGSSTPSSIIFSKHTGESIHLIAFESDRWKVLSHT